MVVKETKVLATLERSNGVKAAEVLGLWVAGVDMLHSKSGNYRSQLITQSRKYLKILKIDLAGKSLQVDVTDKYS